MFNDRLVIIYNTRSDDNQEIIINNKQDIEKIESSIIKNTEKKSLSTQNAERLIDGGARELKFEHHTHHF